MATRDEILGNVDRVVIKVGTSSITMGGSTPSASFMDDVAEQVAYLKNQGKEVLIVSSGAVGIGLKAMNAKPKPNEIPIKQAAASVGQGILMQKWNESVQKVGLNVAQILISMDDYSNRDTVLNLNNTISTLLKYGVVPIFNENDAICIKEIGAAFGDNDTLSAVIASRADADLLVILSDVSGLYTANPSVDPEATLIDTVERITPEILEIAGGPGTKLGTGGMKTKIKAAKICQDAGCMMIIASSSEKDIVRRTVCGDNVGTIFLTDSAITKKRRWMKSVNPHGKIVVDEGAMKALLAHRSLLPVGVKFAEGTFDAGAIVDIECAGTIIARGCTDYGSEDINRVRGMRSDVAKTVLGAKMKYKDVIRSENIALMP
ncbi:MAG: glutamate 5-kinase [archaeon]|nr:glutamate 5-kinase [archaeon]